MLASSNWTRKLNDPFAVSWQSNFENKRPITALLSFDHYKLVSFLAGCGFPRPTTCILR